MKRTYRYIVLLTLIMGQYTYAQERMSEESNIPDIVPEQNHFTACFVNDSSESLCWQQMLTESNPAVRYDFGAHYANGDGVKQDFTKGRYWMHQAALKDFPLAQYNLGVMFVDGLGGTQSKECAVHWLNKSASESDETREMAQQALAALAELSVSAGMPKIYRILTVKECEQLPEAVFPGWESEFARVEDTPDSQPEAEAKVPPRTVIPSDEGVVIETVNVEPESVAAETAISAPTEFVLSPDEPLFAERIPELTEAIVPAVPTIALGVVEKAVPRILNLGGALRSAPKGHYTLQLGSASQAEPLQVLAKKHKLSNYLVYETERHGRRWYVLVSGEYAGIAQAKQALQQLPGALKKDRPWIRSLDHVHTEL